MAQEFKQLMAEWETWARLAGMSGSSSVQQGDGAHGIRFCSQDGDYQLKRDNSWWVIDESDDHGKWYLATATCSTIELAEKYLIWTWGSLARTVVGAEQLGRRFQQQGFNQMVQQVPADRANFVELRTLDGIAVVPNSKSVVLSRVLALPLSQVDAILRAGL